MVFGSTVGRKHGPVPFSRRKGDSPIFATVKPIRVPTFSSPRKLGQSAVNGYNIGRKSTVSYTFEPMMHCNQSDVAGSALAASLANSVPTGGEHAAPSARLAGTSSGWPILLAAGLIVLAATHCLQQQFSMPLRLRRHVRHRQQHVDPPSLADPRRLHRAIRRPASPARPAGGELSRWPSTMPSAAWIPSLITSPTC